MTFGSSAPWASVHHQLPLVARQRRKGWLRQPWSASWMLPDSKRPRRRRASPPRISGERGGLTCLPGAGQHNHRTDPGGSLQTRFHVAGYPCEPWRKLWWGDSATGVRFRNVRLQRYTAHRRSGRCRCVLFCPEPLCQKPEPNEPSTKQRKCPRLRRCRRRPT